MITQRNYSLTQREMDIPHSDERRARCAPCDLAAQVCNVSHASMATRSPSVAQNGFVDANESILGLTASFRGARLASIVCRRWPTRLKGENDCGELTAYAKFRDDRVDLAPHCGDRDTILDADLLGGRAPHQFDQDVLFARAQLLEIFQAHATPTLPSRHLVATR
jgi:hypothetical protein